MQAKLNVIRKLFRGFQCSAFARLALGLTTTLMLSAVQAQTTWQFSTSYPEDNFHTQNIKTFAAEVNAASKGKLKIEVFPNGTLIKQKEIFEGVKTGKAAGGEVILSSLSSQHQIYGIDSIPFLLFGYEDAKKLWDLSRPYIEKALDEQGIKLLFSVPWPPQGIYAAKPITSVKDLKDSKIRTYNPATQRIAELVAAKGVTVSSADLPKALANKEVDTVLTSAATGLDIKAWESVKYFHPVNAWIPKNAVFVNKQAFNALPADLQGQILRLAEAAEARGWKTSEDKNKEFQAQLVSKGEKIVEPTAFLYSEFRRLGETLTREWLRTAGQDGLNVLLQYEVDRFRFNSPTTQK